MMFRKNQIVDVEIEKIAFGGKGVAKPDGFTIFVDQAVPGDVAAVRITRKKKAYAEARIERLVKASSLRVAAPCPYSGYCGGCKWQFLDYAHQVAFKRQHVQESLTHIGRIRDAVVHETLPSENVFSYRNKMEFTCAERRWLLPEEMAEDDPQKAGMALGLHVPGTFFKVLDIEACLLQPPLGNRILAEVRRFIKASDAPVYGLRSHTGFWRFVTLRHSVARDRWMVNLVTAHDNPHLLKPLVDILLSTYPRIVSVVNNVTDSKAGVAVGQKENHLGGEPFLTDSIGPFTFKISANSFFQTNTTGARRLYDTVKAYAALEGNETVLDLYCGTGTIGIYLSDVAGEVIGVEQVAGAVDDAEANCRTNGVDNCRFVRGDMRDCLKLIDARADVVIVDPPRAGMHKDVVETILSMAPDRIVYVSCNPAALARDVAMMASDYRLIEVQPVDLFPHTFHIESVALLTKLATGSPL